MHLTGNEDRRILRTEEAIRGGFESLLLGLPYGRITVQMVCDQSGVTKKTFYAHYHSLTDLLIEERRVRFLSFLQTAEDTLPENVKGFVHRFYCDTDRHPVYERILMVPMTPYLPVSAYQRDYLFRHSVLYGMLPEWKKALLWDILSEMLSAGIVRKIPEDAIVSLLHGSIQSVLYESDGIR